MKKIITVIICMLIYSSLYSQNSIEQNDLKIEIKKSKKTKSSILSYEIPRVDNNLYQTVSVKLNIKIKKGKQFDINKISLVSHNKKMRYRPVNIERNWKILKKELDLGSLHKTQSWIYTKQHDTRDTFLDFNIEGYENIEIQTNFWSDNNPKESIVYFLPNAKAQKHKKKTFHFVINKDDDLSNLNLYFGNENLGLLEF